MTNNANIVTTADSSSSRADAPSTRLDLVSERFSDKSQEVGYRIASALISGCKDVLQHVVDNPKLLIALTVFGMGDCVEGGFLHAIFRLTTDPVIYRGERCNEPGDDRMCGKSTFFGVLNSTDCFACVENICSFRRFSCAAWLIGVIH